MRLQQSKIVQTLHILTEKQKQALFRFIDLDIYYLRGKSGKDSIEYQAIQYIVSTPNLNPKELHNICLPNTTFNQRKLVNKLSFIFQIVERFINYLKIDLKDVDSNFKVLEFYKENNQEIYFKGKARRLDYLIDQLPNIQVQFYHRFRLAEEKHYLAKNIDEIQESFREVTRHLDLLNLRFF